VRRDSNDVRIDGSTVTNSGVIGGSGGTVNAPPAQPHSPPKPSPPAGRANRVGFVVDVVSYGQRTAVEQERIQHRLQALLRTVIEDVGSDFDTVDRDTGTGDGMVVFLPSGSDPTRLLPDLLRAMADRLSADNQVYRDRIRLRMAVGSGVVGRGSNGFSGPLVVNITRLVDCEPLREEAANHPESDLVVLVLDALHRDVVGPGYLPPSVAEFRMVDVAMKEFAERAWVWRSAPTA
jgi:hypothetical protein